MAIAAFTAGDRATGANDDGTVVNSIFCLRPLTRRVAASSAASHKTGLAGRRAGLWDIHICTVYGWLTRH
jgi:hypothetical protein